MVLILNSTKHAFLTELTAPWIDLMEELKRSKYQVLVDQCRRKGWKACCEPREVGCRRIAGHSLCKVYTLLGMSQAVKSRAIKSMMEPAGRDVR